MFSADNLTLSSLKKNPFLLRHILWDFEPNQLMQAQCRLSGEGAAPANPPSGYMLYIETMEKNPGLFLMMQNAAGYAETLGKISDVPEDLLAEAIQENRSKEYCKMYPVNRKLKEWLKRELGVSE
jgi:hypothetical protein